MRIFAFFSLMREFLDHKKTNIGVILWITKPYNTERRDKEEITHASNQMWNSQI